MLIASGVKNDVYGADVSVIGFACIWGFGGRASIEIGTVVGGITAAMIAASASSSTSSSTSTF